MTTDLRLRIQARAIRLVILMIAFGGSSIGARAASGPVAISMNRAAQAVVLQADGDVVSFDALKGVVGRRVFRVPKGFDAVDLAAGEAQGSSVLCLTLNATSSVKYASFLLQRYDNGREVWTWLPDRGVYTGVAIDGRAGHAYVTNSSSNRVYRVEIGDEKAPVTEVANIKDAGALGALAVDTAGRRLFVSDFANGRVSVISLAATAARVTSIDTPAEEVRAVAWSSHTNRILLADAALETVWSVDPDGRSEPRRLERDKRLRDPAGLMVAPDGHLWLVDEAAETAFEISASAHAITRAVKWNR